MSEEELNRWILYSVSGLGNFIRGKKSAIGTKLQEGGSSGFNALLTGECNALITGKVILNSGNVSKKAMDFVRLGKIGYYWSSTTTTYGNTICRGFKRNKKGVFRGDRVRTELLPVRLVKDVE